MLSGKYLLFYKELLSVIPKGQMFHDPLTTLAFGTDASFYRLTPKLVIRATCTEHVKKIITTANQMNISITFRAAGTSLSGQAISDSVLVIVSHGFNKYHISENGNRIKLEPGIRGAYANRYLAKYGKKIGPDPASIDSAMIGGIAANNASGMCCGTSQNSYKTIAEISIILADGTSLDSADYKSVAAFKNTHKDLLEQIEILSKQTKENQILRERIERKYKIKNTTGYSLNALIDFSDPIEIIKHLMIGSEGTLAFIQNITYNTVDDFKNKALSLAIFPTIKEACSAVQILKNQRVSAVELIDRASIRSVENVNGVPDFLKKLPNETCGLLIEIREEKEELLDKSIEIITNALKEFKTIFPIEFTKDNKEQAILWKVRKEALPTIAGMRNPGTTAIIEDVCFPIERLAEAVTELRDIFDKDGYPDAVIFGHALAGNLHFMFNQEFGSKEEVSKYAKLMDDVADMVVNKYDGSLKAEHGTGRNMAPYVEKEWGEQAYSLMKRIKEIFDPKGILNPGVILNDDKNAHISNLKPIPKISESIDKCMECGFCERSCVTEGLTLSPRQRVVAFREIKRLEKNREEAHLLAQLKSKYSYFGERSCATDSLCATACPVKIDNGKITKEIRYHNHSQFGENCAVFIAKHINILMWWLRTSLNLVHFMRNLLGKKIFGTIVNFTRKISGGIIPAWNEHYPKGARKIAKAQLSEDKNSISSKSDRKVIYFPSCLTRSLGKSKEVKEALDLTNLTEKLIKKAGYQIVYPKDLKHLCCGMAFSSKGYLKASKMLNDNLFEALNEVSEGGKYPILCDMSPCLYTMKNNFGDLLPLYEPAEFAQKFLIPNLNIKKIDREVAIWAVCSSKKMGVDNIITEVAKACTTKVKILDGNCCGFAGDKGFFDPKINDWGLRELKKQIGDCKEGYATSRTCEIGLSKNSGIPFKNLLYLLDEVSN